MIVVVLRILVIVPSVRLSAVIVALLVLRVLVTLIIIVGNAVPPRPGPRRCLTRASALVPSLIIGALIAVMR